MKQVIVTVLAVLLFGTISYKLHQRHKKPPNSFVCKAPEYGDVADDCKWEYRK